MRGRDQEKSAFGKTLQIFLDKNIFFVILVSLQIPRRAHPDNSIIIEGNTFQKNYSWKDKGIGTRVFLINGFYVCQYSSGFFLLSAKGHNTKFIVMAFNEKAD